jgi:hypothetical protein
MYVCIRGGPNQSLHRDPQWSVVFSVTGIIPVLKSVARKWIRKVCRGIAIV